MARTGIYPGTFDPITVGHMDIIRRALSAVDKLVIAVALNLTGKAPLFELETRAQLVKEEIRQLGKDATPVEVQTFSGLLVNFAEEVGAKLIIRGLRAVSDFDTVAGIGLHEFAAQPRSGDGVSDRLGEHALHFLSLRQADSQARRRYFSLCLAQCRPRAPGAFHGRLGS